MEEKLYPIYRFWIAFTDRDHNVSSSQMFKKHLNQEKAEQALRKFIESNLDAKRQGQNGEYTMRSLDLEVVGTGWKFEREATWCCQWFNHYTFNTSLTDEDILQSFEKYVRRHASNQVRTGEGIDEHRDRVGDDYVCLMGAEDRWRWKGPCRCEHCQKRSIVMIDH